MQISSRFTMAVHTLLCIDYFGKTQKVTSDFIAASVGTNPAIRSSISMSIPAHSVRWAKRFTLV